MNFHKNASKQQKRIVYLYVAQVEEKKSFVNIYPLVLVLSKTFV